MAKKAKEIEDGDLGSQPKKKNRFLLILILVLVLVILGAGGYLGVAYIKNLYPFSPSGPSPEELALAQAQKEAAMEAQLKDYYIGFDQAFTFNLPTENGNHYMQMEVKLLVIGPDNEALAKQHLSLIGATISEVGAQQTFDQLVSSTGRQRLKSLLLEAIRSKMSGATSKPVVEQVLFTNFVLQ